MTNSTSLEKSAKRLGTQLITENDSGIPWSIFGKRYIVIMYSHRKKSIFSAKSTSLVHFVMYIYIATTNFLA